MRAVISASWLSVIHLTGNHSIFLLNRRLYCRRVEAARQLVLLPAEQNEENEEPNQVRQSPEPDGKSERIRQLHLTLGALIDERDELQDTLSSSASPQLTRQLEEAHAELRVLRKYAGSHTSGRTSLVDLDPSSF